MAGVTSPTGRRPKQLVSMASSRLGMVASFRGQPPEGSVLSPTGAADSKLGSSFLPSPGLDAVRVETTVSSGSGSGSGSGHRPLKAVLRAVSALSSSGTGGPPPALDSTVQESALKKRRGLSATLRLESSRATALAALMSPVRHGSAQGGGGGGFFGTKRGGSGGLSLLSPKQQQSNALDALRPAQPEERVSAAVTLLAVAQARRLAAKREEAGPMSPGPLSPTVASPLRVMSRIGAYRQGLLNASELKPQQGGMRRLESNLRQLTTVQAGPKQGADEEMSAEEARKAELRKKTVRVLKSIAQAGLFAKTSKVAPIAPKGSRGARRPPPLAAPNQKEAVSSLWTVMERGKDGRVALPTAKDLKDLPQDLRKTFTDLAYETMRKFLYPRVLLWRRFTERKKLLQHARATCPPMTLDILKKQAMFKSWPQPLLEELISAVVLMCFEKDEFIIHEGEQAGSGIYFLMAGAVEVLKKKDRRDKRIGGTNAMTLARNLMPVICVGEFSFLTEEPRMASIRATMRCDCMVLKKDDFNRFVKQLPDNVFEQVVEVAFGTRNKNMHLSYPMEEEVLQRCSIFRPCPSPMLRQLLEKIRPYAVPKNMTVAKADASPADRMLFLRNGKCGVMRQIERRITKTMEYAYVHTLRAPCVIGDTAVLHGAPNSDTIQTLSTCDFWLLSKKDFDSVLRHHERVVHLMMAEARLQRQGQLSNQQNLFRECVYEIPLLRDAVKRSQLRTLVKKFEARVYKPLSVICSMANCADRLIILYKGRIRISDSFRRDLPSRAWIRGECAGYTCVVPHRWARMAVSREIVECLELPRADYETFLEANGCLKQVIQWAKVLMFPLAFPFEESEKVLFLVEHLKTPLLYPQSLSTFVNLSERGFCDYHLSYLAEKAGGHAPVEQMAVVPTGGRSPTNDVFSPTSPKVTRRHNAGSSAFLSPTTEQAPSAPVVSPQQQDGQHSAAAAAAAVAAASRNSLRTNGRRRQGRWQRVSSYLWLAGAERRVVKRKPRVLPQASIGDLAGDTMARLDPRQSELVLSLRRIGKDRWRGSAGPRASFSVGFDPGIADGLLTPMGGPISASDVLTGAARADG